MGAATPRVPERARLERARLAAAVDDLELHRSLEVEQRLQRATAVEQDAELAGATDERMRARLVRADMLQRTGQPSVAATLATEVNRWARASGNRPVLARSHLILSSIFEGVGDAAACLDHALRGVELLDEATPPRTRGNFVMRLADALAVAGSFDASRQRYREAQQLFVGIGDVERQLNVLNNLAYAEFEAGDAARAELTAQEMRRLAEASHVALNPAFLDTLARAYLGVGAYARAEAALDEALAALHADGDVQAVTPAELLLTLAEVQRRQDRLASAQATLDRCRAICAQRELSGIDVEALCEQAELHAAMGRFDRAYETHKLYHARTVALSSSRREAAARTRQALFETAEARQEAQRYWRQARTDPLTGLPNRRFVDEDLGARLGGAGVAPLVVAIVDADHFKRINDTLSHEVGDRVIRELASVLQEAVTAGQPADDATARFVARLGGEEFLAVLPGIDVRGAADLLERLRAAVAGHDWRPMVGGLAVTVSVGAAVGRLGDTRADLLARADRSLYVAKRAGRNRVVVDQPVSGGDRAR